jgi:hypothetical protein
VLFAVLAVFCSRKTASGSVREGKIHAFACVAGKQQQRSRLIPS